MTLQVSVADGFPHVLGLIACIKHVTMQYTRCEAVRAPEHFFAYAPTHTNKQKHRNTFDGDSTNLSTIRPTGMPAQKSQNQCCRQVWYLLGSQQSGTIEEASSHEHSKTDPSQKRPSESYRQQTFRIYRKIFNHSGLKSSWKECRSKLSGTVGNPQLFPISVSTWTVSLSFVSLSLRSI